HALDLGHGRELAEKLIAVHRFGRVLIGNLCRHQSDEGVLHLRRITDVHRRARGVAGGAATGLPGDIADRRHQISPSRNRPCCMLLTLFSTSTLVSKLRVADIMSVISSMLFTSG